MSDQALETGNSSNVRRRPGDGSRLDRAIARLQMVSRTSRLAGRISFWGAG